MKALLCLIVWLLIANMHGLAQVRCPELPKSYEWNTPEDYRKDTDLVKKTLRYLTAAPLQLDLVTRSEANLFVMQWIAGSPDVRISIETKNLPFIEDHPELLDSYIHGVALAYLSKDNEVNLVDAMAAGFQSVSQVAAQSKSLAKSRALKPLFKAAKKQQLKQYAQKIVSK